MRLSFTPEYEEGDEITEKNANGVVCVTYKSPDTLKRITMELALCEPDAELTNLISGGLLLRKNMGTFATPNQKSVGWASPAVGDDPAGYGVAIECWSHAIKDGKKSATLPYFHWVFPFAKLRQSGDRVIENGMLATTFEGYGLGNILFGSGIDGRWEYPVAAERPYSYARTTYAPTGLTGFYTWAEAGNEVVAVTNVALANNTATLTYTGTANTVVTGDQILIQGVGSPFDTIGAEYLTVTGHAAQTASVTITAANVASAVATGSIIVINEATETTNASAYTAVTNFGEFDGVGGSGVDFNVPGNIDFNPDIDVDRIIQSNEDPTS
jgi:hypothetical protein